jgi:uncharacterized protein YciI
MQFMVTGYDGTDPGALARRLAVREAHLKLGKEMHDAGKWLYAAGILNEAGTLVGSMIICDFPSREELEQQWLEKEPYIIGRVWQKVDVQRVQVAPFCAAK